VTAHPLLKRAAELGDVAGDALGAVLVGAARIFVVPQAAPDPWLHHQGPVPEGATAIYHELLGGLALDEDTKQKVNGYVADRLEAYGYQPEALNFGALRCLAGHDHEGSDGECIACRTDDGSVVYLRCHGSDREGIARLLAVAQASTLGSPIRPLCPDCGEHDAEPVEGLGAVAALREARVPREDRAAVLNEVLRLRQLRTAPSNARITAEEVRGAEVNLGKVGDVGGIGTTLSALFIALIIAAGAASVEAARLVEWLRDREIEIVKPNTEPRPGWAVLGEGELGPVRESFEGLFGATLGTRLLNTAVSRGWRYAKRAAPTEGAVSGLGAFVTEEQLAAEAAIAETREELSTQTKGQIEATTARKWCARAIVALENYAEGRAPNWLLQAGDYAHEAIEHAAQAGHGTLRSVRGELAAAKRRLGLEALEDLGEALGGVLDDLETAWDICSACRKIGATVGKTDPGRVLAAVFSGGVSEVARPGLEASHGHMTTFTTGHHHGHPQARPHEHAHHRRATHEEALSIDIPTVPGVVLAAPAEDGLDLFSGDDATLAGGELSDEDLFDLGALADGVDPGEPVPLDLEWVEPGVAGSGGLGGYRSLAADHKAKEDAGDLEGEDDGLGRDNLGAALSTMGNIGSSSDDQIVAYLKGQNEMQSQKRLHDLLDDLRRHRVYIALPGETLPVNATVIEPATNPQLRMLLREIPTMPEKGSLSTGAARLFLPGSDDTGAGPPGDILLLDVRSPAEFTEKHLEGAINIPLDELQELPERIEEVRKLANGRRVVCFCVKGMRAASAVQILRAAGIDAVSGHKDVGCRCAPKCADAEAHARASKEALVALLRPEEGFTTWANGIGVTRAGGAAAIEVGYKPGSTPRVLPRSFRGVPIVLVERPVAEAQEGVDDVGGPPEHADVGALAVSLGPTIASGALRVDSSVYDAPGHTGIDWQGHGGNLGRLPAGTRVDVVQWTTPARAGKPSKTYSTFQGPGGGKTRAWVAIRVKGQVSPGSPTAGFVWDEVVQRDAAGTTPASRATPRTPASHAAVHKVQQLAGAWEAMEARTDGAFTDAMRGYYDRWLAFWRAWKLGDRAGLAGAVADTNAAMALGLADADKTRIADMHARIKVHNEAVEKAKETLGEEPEFKEYLARWTNLVAEMNKLGERATATLSWIGGDEIKFAENDLNRLINEWNDLLPKRIELRKKTKQNEEIEAALKRAKDKEAEGKAEGPKPGEKPTVVKPPDVKPEMERSTATTPTAGPGSAPEKKPGDCDAICETKKTAKTLAIGGGLALGLATALKVMLGRVF
jgi:rhodanese-related sulfurtransferase